MVTTFGTRSMEEPLPCQALSTVGFDDGGYAVKLGAGQKLDVTTGITDAPFGVTVDGTTDATTGATLLGQLVSVMRHGIVPVKSEAVTWVRGDIAYLAATDGYVTNVDGGSAKRLGMYVGDNSNTVVAGEKVEVDLDSKTDVN